MKSKLTLFCTLVLALLLFAGCARLETPDEALVRRYDLAFADQPLDGQVVCVRNRPYVDPKALGPCTERGKLSYRAKDLTFARYQIDGKPWISLADAAVLGGLEASFDPETETVRLYRRAAYAWPAETERTEKATEETTAYLRLEDIMADRGLNGRFTHENLTLLRFFGDYLKDRTEAFYIAWIPMYVNPEEGVVNDVSEDLDFYNADFVYTLDRLVTSGGLLGLHGYTHQSGETISAIGIEFGKDADLTREQVLERFDKAADICSKLGYTYTFFEFPHYAVTPEQCDLCSEYFDVSYQQLPDADPQGRIESVTINDHTCRWVPTPADYVYDREDLPGISERLTKSHDNGQVLSLFFHPILDYKFMELDTQGQTMTFSYHEDEGLIAGIVRLVESWGCRFGSF